MTLPVPPILQHILVPVPISATLETADMHLSHDIEASTQYLIACLHYTRLRFMSAYIFMWFCTKDRNTRHDKPKATLTFTQHKGRGELALFAVTVRICTKITAED